MNQRTLLAEELRELFRSDIDTMHNLQRLVVGQVKLSEPLETYLKRIDHHLQHLTDCLLPYIDSPDQVVDNDAQPLCINPPMSGEM
jgi:hypothetical protein